ncbi:Glyoxylate reductase [Rhynchospora pubera]|uniref:Glyoxylate reductase n=1 Tax=Rhynchospora pubera TaxID=906938 RepID=A0AAV8CVR5_9POAL|nr:Glyoxylate reductase [Rhynchospora pubera]
MATTTSTTNTPKIEEKPKVLVLQRINAYFEGVLSPHFDLVKADESSLPIPAFLSTHCRHIRALLVMAPIGTFGSSLLDQLPSLGLIACTSAGVNHIDVDACRKRSVAVTNAGEMFTPDAADYTVGLLVDVLRRVVMADRYVRNGSWMLKGDYPLGSKVSGKRVGIVGLGSIGSHVAKRLTAFGCPISYFSRAPKPNYPSYTYFPNVLDLARESDVLILSCALTDETRNIINRDVMIALGKDGVIINVGRGALIDEPELVRCLKEGVIGGAGLDVFVNEPEVPEELTHMENVVLSDHRAVTTPESFKNVLELAIANLDAFFSGKPLLSPVSC